MYKMTQIHVFLIATVYLLIRQVASIPDRHVIYWNIFSSPKLLALNNEEFVLHVKIGEFLDILCPHQDLMGITNGPERPAKFDLYNVTKKNYEKCHNGGDKKTFIFACNRPETENKLTIKFQTISPSPLGFRFQYCAEYYFVALSRHHKHPGCKKNSTRIRIIVQCKDTDDSDKAKTPTPISTTQTTTTTISTRNDTQRWFKPKTDKEPSSPPPTRTTLKTSRVPGKGVYGGRRGASDHVTPALWRTLTFCCTVLLFNDFLRQELDWV